MSRSVPEMAKRVLEVSGFEIDENGLPLVRVGEVEWVQARPSWALDFNGNLEIYYKDEDWNGGWLNGEWRRRGDDGNLVSAVNQGGAYIFKGGTNANGRTCDPGELIPYNGNDNGTYIGPHSLFLAFTHFWLVTMVLDHLPEGAETTFILLGEHPNTWDQPRLESWLEGVVTGFDVEQFFEVAEWIWEHLEGVSAMFQSDIDESIQESVKDDSGGVWPFISEYVSEHGVPQEPVFIPKGKKFSKDLIFARTGWRHDPDLDPDDENALLQICRKGAPDRYPSEDDETGVSVHSHAEKNGWTYVLLH